MVRRRLNARHTTRGASLGPTPPNARRALGRVARTCVCKPSSAHKQGGAPVREVGAPPSQQVYVAPHTFLGSAWVEKWSLRLLVSLPHVCHT